MADLYIYYRVRDDHAATLAPRVRAMQTALSGRHGVAGQLKRRPASAAGVQTWMEIYPAAPDQFDDLAKIYQAMKPAAAALVLEQLDLDVQMRVAQRMRERSTAMILAAMTPKAAAALTMALARRQAPRPSYVTPAGVKPQMAKR